MELDEMPRPVVTYPVCLQCHQEVRRVSRSAPWRHPTPAPDGHQVWRVLYLTRASTSP